MLSTAQACRAQGVIRFLAPLSLGLSYADFCLTRFRAAAEAATEGLRLAQDTGQPVRAAGLYSVLALLAAVSGDETRCHEMAAGPGISSPATRWRTSAGWRNGRWDCSISASAGTPRRSTGSS